MCPHGRRLLAGEGGLLEPAEVVCHCLLIETDDGLVLVDTGFGVEDTRDLGRLGAAFRLMRPKARARRDGAQAGRGARLRRRRRAPHRRHPPRPRPLRRPARLPRRRGPRLRAASWRRRCTRSCRTGRATAACHWDHGPKWVRHDVEGDEWFGFEGVRILPGTGAEMLLVPLAGHSRGHSGVALQDRRRLAAALRRRLLPPRRARHSPPLPARPARLPEPQQRRPQAAARQPGTAARAGRAPRRRDRRSSARTTPMTSTASRTALAAAG